jgi:hypothetical protein
VRLEEDAAAAAALIDDSAVAHACAPGDSSDTTADCGGV